MQNYYEVLGVAQESSFETIKAAYRRLAIHLHPDKNTAPNATEAFQQLGQAWAILQDDKARGAYDRQLNASKRTVQPASPAPYPTPKSARTAYSPFEYPDLDLEQEAMFFFEELKNTPVGRSYEFINPMPDNTIRTDSDIAEGQIIIQKMKTEYQTKLKEVANKIKAKYLELNIQKSEDEVQEAARADAELVRLLANITYKEGSVKSRFDERVAEAMNGMKL